MLTRASSLPNLTGKFDIIFVDIAFDAYEDTVRTVLDNELLAPDGVILVDNGRLYRLPSSFQDLILQSSQGVSSRMTMVYPTLTPLQCRTGGKQAQ